jgi:hypothetical protein
MGVLDIRAMSNTGCRGNMEHYIVRSLPRECSARKERRGQIEYNNFPHRDSTLGHIYTATDLRTADYTIDDLRTAGYTIDDLRAAGYTAWCLRIAGYSLREQRMAGYIARDLRRAGYTASDLKAAGMPAGSCTIV